MGRRSTKGCIYCNTNSQEGLSYGEVHMRILTGAPMVENSDEFRIINYNPYGFYIRCLGKGSGKHSEVPINYCPICGKKLNKE